MKTFKQYINEGGFKKDIKLITTLRKDFFEKQKEWYKLVNIDDGIEVHVKGNKIEDTLFDFLEDNDIEVSVSSTKGNKFTIKTYA